ncbi:hypothetical protein GCM10027299_20640 [Larkinella ripae]
MSLSISLCWGEGKAQGVPRIGNQLEFAGVTIHLTEATQHFVQQEAELLYVNRALVMAKLEKMNLYFPVIRPLLAQHSLSDDFLFLALYDRGTAADAPSTGFWALGNLKPRELRIDAFVDERLHPARATLAVISRLKQLHQRKPNWVSVVHGYDQLLRADTAQTLTQEPGEGRIYALRDTQDEFLIRLLASKIVLERAMSVYTPQNQKILFSYKESKGKSLSQIAEYCRIDAASLDPCNSWLKAPRVPDAENYTVYVPVTLDQYAALKRQANPGDEKPADLQDAGFPVLQRSAESGNRGGIFYQINGKKGIQAQLYDNRITLAYAGKLNVRKFEKYNDLRSDRPIVAGEIYYLRKKSKRANVPFHIVRRGQSLWAIAQQYGIKLQKLIDYNGVNPEQQPAVARILWLQRKRPSTLPIEYYRSPKQPESAPAVPQTAPVLVVNKPDSTQKHPTEERIAQAEKPPANVPSRKTLATLDSLIAALNEPEAPRFRSGATKMIQPVALTENKAPEKLAEDESEEGSGPLIMHIAEKTDTYLTVARKYKVTVAQLYVWNNLSAAKPLRSGQLLLIDQSKTPTKKGLIPLAAKPAPAKKPLVKPALSPMKNVAAKPAVLPSGEGPTSTVSDGSPARSADQITHVVKAGENLYRIGLRYHVKPEQIQQWNHLPGLTAIVGARLVVWKK